jgi:carbonic anhydrase
MFVHRNVANIVIHTDLNCLSTIQYAVEVLGVGHIIVCGHYHCGGIRAALHDEKYGLIDNWLRHVQDVRWKYEAQLDALETDDQKLDRLCELNVIEQVLNVCETTVIRDAWRSRQQLAVHGWIYDVGDGLLEDLDVCVTKQSEVGACFEAARGTKKQTLKI